MLIKLNEILLVREDVLGGILETSEQKGVQGDTLIVPQSSKTKIPLISEALRCGYP